jgi:alpha-L-fucosidase 2
VFHDLRARGGFLVSACMQNSTLFWVRIKSLEGEPCLLKCSFATTPHAVTLHGEVDVHRLGDDLYQLDLKRGDEVLLTTDERMTRARVEPLRNQSGSFNEYGLHDRQNRY